MKYFVFDIVFVVFLLYLDLNVINAICGLVLFLTKNNSELIFYLAPVIVYSWYFAINKVNDLIFGLIPNNIKSKDYANDI